MVIEKNQYGWKMKVSPLNPSWLERPAMQSSQHFKNFKKDHLFEGTVDSRKHNS